MDYPNQSVRMIKLYRSFSTLWDPKHPDYVDKCKREKCWKQIAIEADCPVSVAKKKMESLMGSYRREKSREKRSSGEDGSAYRSKWFAYPYFKFLQERNRPSLIADTWENENATERPAIESPLAEYVNVGGEMKPFSQLTTETIAIKLEESINSNNDEPQTSETAAIKMQESINRNNDEPQTSHEVIKEHRPRPVATLRRPLCAKRRSPRRAPRKKKTESTAAMLVKTLTCLQKSAGDFTDPYVSFGKHIANELRKYDRHTLACVKNAINHIIFDADMGNYRKQRPEGFRGFAPEPNESPNSFPSSPFDVSSPEDMII